MTSQSRGYSYEDFLLDPAKMRFFRSERGSLILVLDGEEHTDTHGEAGHGEQSPKAASGVSCWSGIHRWPGQESCLCDRARYVFRSLRLMAARSDCIVRPIERVQLIVVPVSR